MGKTLQVCHLTNGYFDQTGKYYDRSSPAERSRLNSCKQLSVTVVHTTHEKSLFASGTGSRVQGKWCKVQGQGCRVQGTGYSRGTKNAGGSNFPLRRAPSDLYLFTKAGSQRL